MSEPIRQCVRKKSKPWPALVECTNLDDFSPGSCARINIARLLDHLDYLDRRDRFIEAACGLENAPVDTP